MSKTNEQRDQIEPAANNMELWNRVQSTPPGRTKTVEFGRKYTSVDPQYQLRVATGIWGPYGKNWGVKNLDYSQIGSSMMLQCIFYYPGGEFPIAVDMPFKDRDDCCKKLLTSARSKALSYLGFNSDVYEGKFEDSMYVSAMEIKYDEAEEKLEQYRIHMRRAASPEDLGRAMDRARSLYSDDAITTEQFDSISSLYHECLELLGESELPRLQANLQKTLLDKLQVTGSDVDAVCEYLASLPYADVKADGRAIKVFLRAYERMLSEGHTVEEIVECALENGGVNEGDGTDSRPRVQEAAQAADSGGEAGT